METEELDKYKQMYEDATKASEQYKSMYLEMKEKYYTELHNRHLLEHSAFGLYKLSLWKRLKFALFPYTINVTELLRLSYEED